MCLDDSDVSSFANIPFNNIDVLESHIIQPLQRVPLPTQKRRQIPKHTSILGRRVQRIVHVPPLRIDHHDEPVSGLLGYGFDGVYGFLRGLDEAADVVGGVGCLRHPQTHTVDAGFIDTAVFYHPRGEAALVFGEFSQYFLTGRCRSSIELHNPPLPGLIGWHQQQIVRIESRIVLKVLPELSAGRIAWQENSYNLACDTTLLVG
mmetsp:Transcript_29649/g.42060  ORF Transcript_29649/g.42060 Transcript_29649/m.42060 type:complete len:205 (-) Transcript_29649:874-1488(-)